MPITQTSSKNLIIVFFISVGLVAGLVWTFLMPPPDLVRWVLDPRDNHEKVNNGLLSDEDKGKELKAKITVLQEHIESVKAERSKNESDASIREIQETSKFNNEISDLKISKERASIEIENLKIKLRKNEHELESLKRKNRELSSFVSINKNDSLSGKVVAIYFQDDVASEASLLKKEVEKLGARVVLNLGDGSYEKKRYMYYLNGENLIASDRLFSVISKEFYITGKCPNRVSNKYDIVIVLN